MTSVLATPEVLPLRSLSEIIASLVTRRVVIVAPHPDDETLGCGGMIALLNQAGFDIKILVISDGTMSHPNSRRYPKFALRALRERETLTAMATLGIQADAITFLRLTDGALPTSDMPEFSDAVHQCQAYLGSGLPQTIFVPWRSDPHPDHRATWQITGVAVQSFANKPRLIEYPIWDWDMTQRGRCPNTTHTSWRLNIASVVDLKQQAIAAYRSQTTNLIDDDPEGFCLTPDMLTNFQRPWELYFEEIR